MQTSKRKMLDKQLYRFGLEPPFTFTIFFLFAESKPLTQAVQETNGGEDAAVAFGSSLDNVDDNTAAN